MAPETSSALAVSDPDLDAWLAAGSPPVYWGFGSMPVADPRATLELVRAVSRQLGVRSLVCAGWSEFAADADPQVRVFGAVDHRTVFPRCAAAVHHGGAGTTAAALRAGTPSLVAWFGADQQLWGRRLADLGVGEVVRFRELDTAGSGAALTRLTTPAVRARAAEVRTQLIDPAAARCALADLVEIAEAQNNWRTGRSPRAARPLPTPAPAPVLALAPAPEASRPRRTRRADRTRRRSDS